MVDAVGVRLRERGERLTVQRRAVLEALAAAHGHPTAEVLADAVTNSETRVHRASVYRTLEALCALGVVQHVHLGHGATAYHLVSVGGAHPHSQCSECGAVLDLPADLLDEVSSRLAEAHGFVLDATHVALSGRCATCVDEPATADAPGPDRNLLIATQMH